MKVTYLLESLQEVKLAFGADGDPHVNGESRLRLDLTDDTALLQKAPGVVYEATAVEVVKEAMELLGIKVEVV